MKRALVTGATRGIGKAIAIALIEEGYFVYATFCSSKAKANAIESEHKNIKFIQADFSDRIQTLRVIEELKAENLNLIVNNAGVVHFDTWAKFSVDNWDETMEVNLSAPLLLSKGLSGNMGPGSSIVNIASTDGMTGAYATIAYAASKAGLINLTTSLANVLGDKKIRVNSISPGWVQTEMVTEFGDESASTIPSGRIGTPKDVANAVVFLASDNADYVNGANIVIDGGDTNASYELKKEAGAKQ